MHIGKLSHLYYYPIKSCQGITLQEAKITRRGIHNDRQWMVVDQTGRFMTQREHPRMALISVTLSDNLFTLHSPTQTPVTVQPTQDGNHLNVQVWRDHCVAIDQGDRAAVWLTKFLGTPCRLVQIAEDAIRSVDPVYAPRLTDQVAFSDGFPVLLISEASLDDLNQRLEQPIPMNRFRPNIVATNCAAYAEDHWRQIRIGEVIFDVVKPCTRCVITTTDQQTLERTKEPLRTLATYRKQNNNVLFGQNLVHANEGLIRVGDAIERLA